MRRQARAAGVMGRTLNTPPERPNRAARLAAHRISGQAHTKGKAGPKTAGSIKRESRPETILFSATTVLIPMVLRSTGGTGAERHPQARGFTSSSITQQGTAAACLREERGTKSAERGPDRASQRKSSTIYRSSLPADFALGGAGLLGPIRCLIRSSTAGLQNSVLPPAHR